MAYKFNPLTGRLELAWQEPLVSGVTVKSINGQSLLGAGNIVTNDVAARLSEPRTLTVGATGKSFDGTANVSWSLAEIGAASATHTHTDATTSAAGFMSSADKTKLDGVATGANNYSHPTGDGNLHVPATGTTNNGKVLKAGSTAGDLSWGTLTASDVGAATSSHNHDASYPTLAAFNALVDRVAALEDVLGDIQSALDAINGV